MLRRHQGLAAEEERGLHLVVGDAVRTAGPQRLGNVGLLGEAVMGDHRMEALAQTLDLDPVGVGHDRHVHRVDLQDDDALVQDLVVLEIVQEGGRGVAGVGGQEDGGAGDSVRCALHAL